MSISRFAYCGLAELRRTTRKNDPGELFDWRRLWQSGVGLWSEPRPIGGGGVLSRGHRSVRVRGLQSQLSKLGYGVAACGEFDVTTEAVVRAFQRHFRPIKVDGVADRSTIGTLADILALKARHETHP